MYDFNNFGLDKKDIKKIFENHFKENADILIGIDDPEVNQLVDILVNAFTEVVDRNNEQITEDVKNYIGNNTVLKKGNFM